MFRFPPGYPHVAVNLQATNLQNLNEAEVAQLLTDLKAVSEGCARLGEVSVFDLVDRCQEWLRDAEQVDVEVRLLSWAALF